MLVDEFQDLTPAHLLLIRLLASPGGAVFGVGDDDQTIYGYNGADPAWLIDFADLFPGAGTHPLEVNYRCPAGIVDIVDRLLRHNERRVRQDHPGRISTDTRRLEPSTRPSTRSPRPAARGRRRAACGSVCRSGRRAHQSQCTARAGAGRARGQRHPHLRRCRPRVRRPHRRALGARRGSGWRPATVARPRRHPRGTASPVAIVPSAHQRLGVRTAQHRRPASSRGPTEQRTRPGTRHRLRRRHPDDCSRW